MNTRSTLLILIAAIWFPCVHAVEPAAAASNVAALDASFLTRETLSDARVRELLGPGEGKVIAVDALRDKAEAEAYLDGRREAPPARSASVLVWNKSAGKAARALLSVPDGKVMSVTAVKSADVPLLPDELEEALKLVKASGPARQAVGPSLERYRVVASGEDSSQGYAAQALPVRSYDKADSCAIAHCLDFIFREQRSYLPLRVHVDLGRQSVEVMHAGARPESHS